MQEPLLVSHHCFRARADISEKVGLAHPDEAEAYILKMVEAGEICAQITSPAGTVHFREDAHMSSSASVTSRLEADLQSTADLTERVRKLEARLMVNPAFIQKVCCCCRVLLLVFFLSFANSLHVHGRIIVW